MPSSLVSFEYTEQTGKKEKGGSDSSSLKRFTYQNEFAGDLWEGERLASSTMARIEQMPQMSWLGERFDKTSCHQKLTPLLKNI